MQYGFDDLYIIYIYIYIYFFVYGFNDFFFFLCVCAYNGYNDSYMFDEFGI